LNNLAEQYLVFAEGQATRRMSMTMQAWMDCATVPQKHCACARPKTATHCPKSAAMAQGVPPSDRVSQVNVNRAGKTKKIFSVG
jgi:hypothetical protein